MNSTPPDEPSLAREPLLIAGGKSIELGALITRLKNAGVRVVPLCDADEFEQVKLLQPDLLVWDLATPGLLTFLESFLRPRAPETEAFLAPDLIALGSPPHADAATGELVGRAVRHFRRPLDVQMVADAVRARLSRPKSLAPPSKAPQSHPPAGMATRLSLPAGSVDVELSGNSASHPPPADDVSMLPSRQFSGASSENSVVSPELAGLLAEAENRVEAQIALEAHRGDQAPAPERRQAELGDDVWQLLDEPLEDDAELQAAEGFEDSQLPSALEAAAGDPALPDLGTLPPEPPPDSPYDEDTGSHAPDPDAETAGSVVPKTSTSVAQGVQTTRAERARLPVPSVEAPPTLPPQRAPHPREQETPLPSEESEPGPTSAPARFSTLGPLSEEADVPRTVAPREEPLRPPSEAPAADEVPSLPLDLPGALVLGASALVLGRAVRQRFSGCLAFEVDQGLRRVIFRDGDVVIATSAVHGESLVSYLAQRGDLTSEAATQIEHRIPNFGRHAGAALIARGLLEQGELWPVLRAHAEWVLGRILRIERGTVREESPVPERLAQEPAVFGGATGAEVLVEAMQRAVKPDQALAQLGGSDIELERGEAFDLRSECALPAELNAELDKHELLTLSSLQRSHADPMLPSVVQALVALNVLKVALERSRRSSRPPAKAKPSARLVETRDVLDDEALRLKVKARRALVDEGDYFALLGVPREATGYEIRRSYTELRRQFDASRVLRPNTLDLQEDVDAILELLDEAYEILKDQSRRERYRRAIESVP
jgi:hypothetical protein